MYEAVNSIQGQGQTANPFMQGLGGMTSLPPGGLQGMMQQLQAMEGALLQQQQGDTQGAAQTQSQIQQDMQELTALMGGQQAADGQNADQANPLASGDQGGQSTPVDSGNQEYTPAQNGSGNQNYTPVQGSDNGGGGGSAPVNNNSGSGDDGGSGQGTSGEIDTSGDGGDAVKLAQSQLGKDAQNVNLANYSAAGGCTNDCADFVSACEADSGRFKKNAGDAGVVNFRNDLIDQGWHQVSQKDAQPGDVAIILGGGVEHTELVANKGATTCIGANGTSQEKVSTDNPSGWSSHVTYYAPSSEKPGAGNPDTKTANAPKAAEPTKVADNHKDSDTRKA